ncbi:hypothetical protein, partial [Urechidicola vernalis]
MERPHVFYKNYLLYSILLVLSLNSFCQTVWEEDTPYVAELPSLYEEDYAIIMETNVLNTSIFTAICQDFTIQLDASGNAIISPSDIDAGSGSGILSIDISTFTCSDIGDNIVILTHDDSGTITT